MIVDCGCDGGLLWPMVVGCGFVFIFFLWWIVVATMVVVVGGEGGGG